MNVKIISLLERWDEAVVRNHTHFAQQHQYEHQWAETHHFHHPKLKLTYKYNYLLQQLKAMNEGDLVLMLDGQSAVFYSTDVRVLMHGRDSLILEGPTDSEENRIIMANFIALRNTPQIRAHLHEILQSLHGVLGDKPFVPEEILLQVFNVLPINTALGDVYINVNWHISYWFNAKIFVVYLGASPIWKNGEVTHDSVRSLSHDRNLEKLLMRQINGAFIDGQPMMKVPNYPALSQDNVSHYNTQASIALITLYTHHITTYARVSEHNVKRYCDRHHYAYHVYRAIPDELDPNINGTWVKSWLLKNNIANHEWVIWVDADVLFRNQHLKLEPLLKGKDFLFAKDLCAWPINAGIMGFRNTPENIALLEAIWQHMVEVKDKSTVYSEQGDQFHTINVLNEHGLLTEANVENCLTINTAPAMSTNNTFLTHYVGWGEPYRSVYMAHDDALSQRNG